MVDHQFYSCGHRVTYTNQDKLEYWYCMAKSSLYEGY